MWEVKVPKAFVLICAEMGSESEVLKKLKNMEGVEEAFAVYGVHDIIAKISTETMNKLNAIVRRIERTDKVKSTRMLIIKES
jgi:DNA-binding Lrp family transcriptional regulator